MRAVVDIRKWTVSLVNKGRYFASDSGYKRLLAYSVLLFPALALMTAFGCAGAATQRTSTSLPQPTATTMESLPSPTEEISHPTELPPVGTGVGHRIPEFTISLTDGTTVSLDDLLQEQRPTFLFFFATW
jgi:hypothetical protein